MEQEVPWWQKVLKLEPALIRGVLVALAALLLQIFGKTIIEAGMVDAVIDFFTSISALVAALMIRAGVTPNAKVLLRDDTPLATVTTLASGEAIPPEVVTNEQLLEALGREPHAA